MMTRSSEMDGDENGRMSDLQNKPTDAGDESQVQSSAKFLDPRTPPTTTEISV